MQKMKITRKQLRRLIGEALRQNEPGYHRSYQPDTKGINYTALVLDEYSHNVLLQFVPEGWKPIAHHMTMITPALQKGSRLPMHYLNQPGEITAIGIVGDDRVIAAVIDPTSSTLPYKGPEFLHVTIATNPLTKGKPFMSNKLDLALMSPINRLVLTGTIQELS